MRFLIGLAILLSPCMMDAQDPRLALQYFNDGEFEKAAVLYEKLFSLNEENDFYFERYIESLLSTQAFDDAEKVIKRQLKKNPANVSGVKPENQKNSIKMPLTTFL